MPPASPHSLFSVLGVELEYMIVDRATLEVRPICDVLLRRLAALPGAEVEEEENGQPSQVAITSAGTRISVSNELVLHVVEFKTTDPVRLGKEGVPAMGALAAAESGASAGVRADANFSNPKSPDDAHQSLSGFAALAASFQEAVAAANRALAAEHCMLLPTGMHPWMDPFKDMKLWPHGYSEVYTAFDRLFDCRGHGWANLQSVHVNLPFAGDDEFGRLHAAIRFLLPILPALSASSPIMDARATGLSDNRMEVYRKNSDRVPEVRGLVVPEPAYTFDEYDRLVFQPLYRAIAPLDPGGVLQHEWLNARGAIARFTRGAIEIRVLDVQECPAADLAVVALILAAVRAVASERYGPIERFMAYPTQPLATLLLATIRDADATALAHVDGAAEYVSMFGAAANAGGPDASAREGGIGAAGVGVGSGGDATLGRLWDALAADLESSGFLAPADAQRVRALRAGGSLARRILRAVAPAGSPAAAGSEGAGGGAGGGESGGGGGGGGGCGGGGGGVDLPRERLREVYSSIAACLNEGNLFRPR